MLKQFILLLKDPKRRAARGFRQGGSAARRLLGARGLRGEANYNHIICYVNALTLDSTVLTMATVF